MTLRDLDRSTFRRFTLEVLDYIYYYIMLEDQIKKNGIHVHVQVVTNLFIL